MIYPNAISKLEEDLASAPDTPVTELAHRIIESAKAYDNFRTQKTIEGRDYPGGIKRDFSTAVEYTADHIIGAPWADNPDTPLEDGETWNKGRRACLTGQKYDLDENGLPINPYINTGIKGRGVAGLHGPNHAVDVGVLTVKEDETDTPSLYAYGIKKGRRAAFCGGFTEYNEKDENGIVAGRDAWVLNQAKEFFEEMVSGSVELISPFAEGLEAKYQKELASRIEKREGKPLPERQVNEIRKQIETELKLRQVQEQDPDFLRRLHEVFQEGRECFAGPVRATSRSTNTSWMETYLSWVFMDDKTWNHIRGEDPPFDYQFAAGDDADDVVAHRIDKNLLENSAGTHSAMFLFMSASYLLDSQKKGIEIDPNIINQLEEAADFLAPFCTQKADEVIFLSGDCEMSS